MAAIVRMLSGLLMYSCVATTLTATAGVVYLRASGVLSDDTLHKLAAVMAGADLASEKDEAEPNKKEPDAEQPSYEDRQMARDLLARNLELREQSLNSRLELVRSEMRTLVVDKERHERIKNAFKEQLAEMRDEAVTSGMENVRLIWEKIKPKQVKDLIMEMLGKDEINEVVSILSAMPNDNRARIIAEFKTSEDTARLDEILRLIREGVPQTNLIDNTVGQLQH